MDLRFGAALPEAAGAVGERVDVLRVVHDVDDSSSDSARARINGNTAWAFALAISRAMAPWSPSHRVIIENQNNAGSVSPKTFTLGQHHLADLAVPIARLDLRNGVF